MNIFGRTSVITAAALLSSSLAFALPSMPAGGAMPAPPPMPKINCGVTAPEYIVATPGLGLIASTAVTLNNAQAQLYRASLCMVSAQRDLLVALNMKELGDQWASKLSNLSGTTVNVESQAALLKVAADPALNDALTAATANLSAASEEQKQAIRSADLKRGAAGLALASLAVDAGRMVIDIATLVKKIQDKDPSIVEELAKAEYSLQLIQLWPEQIKQIGASASSFGKAAKDTDKVIKAIYKAASMEPPKAADIKQALSASGDE